MLPSPGMNTGEGGSPPLASSQRAGQRIYSLSLKVSISPIPHPATADNPGKYFYSYRQYQQKYTEDLSGSQKNKADQNTIARLRKLKLNWN